MFDSMPRYLKGIDCFREMMEANDTTRMNQGAWEGWYYEFFVERYLHEHPTGNIVWWSKKGNGQLDFDLRLTYEEWFYGDMKSDAEKNDVQGNLKENIDLLVLENGGRLWYIALNFTPERDSDHGYETTKWWNQKLGKVNNLMSYCKRMKYAIRIHKMDIYENTSWHYGYKLMDCINHDAKQGKAIENLVVYDVLNALGYPMKEDGTCDFANARKFINKQLRAWVGVIANNGCDVALYVEQDQYDTYNAANDFEVKQSFWTATGLTEYIAAPKDDHKYSPVATILTSWERPINLRETEIDAALDANTGENTIYLLDYLKLFDWRGDAPHQGYMYDGTPNHWWFWGYYNVKGIGIDMDPSNIWTNMHQDDPEKFVKMSSISTQVRLFVGEPYMDQAYHIFGLGWDQKGNRIQGVAPADDWKLWQYVPASQESAIEQYMGISPRNESRLSRFGSIYYENNGDNVTEFDVLIPITIFYEWGSQKYCTRWHIDTTHGRTTPKP